jgi:trigger factor
MELQVEESGPLERKLRIEVPTVDVDAAFDAVFERLRRKAHLKGFRPGKAPRAVLERYFGDEVRSDVLDHIVRETLPKAVDRAELAIVAPPKVNSSDTPRQGAPFAYEARVEIRPVIELKQVRGLVVPEPVLPEPERDPVEQYLEELRTDSATLHPEGAGTRAARGHVAVLELRALRDGEPWLDGEQRSVVIGDERIAAGFDEQLIGLQEGETRSFELDLPGLPPAASHDPDHEHGPDCDHDHDHAPGLPAQPAAPVRAAFTVRLRELKRRELPGLDDEFAKDVSEFETLEQLRADLRARVEKGRESERQRRREQAALDALIAANEFPVPQSLVEEQLRRRMVEVLRGLQIDPQSEAFRSVLGELGERLRPQAERDVRAGFLVREVARAESIEVRDEEVDAQARELAAARGESARQILRETRDSELGEALRQHLLERRVFAFLLEHAVPARA